MAHSPYSQAAQLGVGVERSSRLITTAKTAIQRAKADAKPNTNDQARNG